MRRAGSILLMLLLAGCGTGRHEELLPVDKAPAGLLETAQQAQPEVTFDQVLKRPDGRYEFRGTTKSGRIKKVTVSSAGDVLQTK